MGLSRTTCIRYPPSVFNGALSVRWSASGKYPSEEDSEPCLEPETVRLLDEVTRKAEAGDVDYLKGVGRVFQTVATS